MKTIVLALLLFSLLGANSELETCVKCHPLIVQEFDDSMHKNSTLEKDEIHSAIWDKHPLKAKDDYTCAACHSPNEKSPDHAHQGVTCITCHTIKDVQEHTRENKNIYHEDNRTFSSAQAGREHEKVIYKQESSLFGMNKTTVGSPYHDIDYTNEAFYTAKVCMGCHSHRKNSHEFMLCKTDEAGAKDKEENCISCHMPKVDGSATTIRQSKKHAFHGFAGARKHPQMLTRYIELGFKKTANGFDVSVQNKAPHDFMLHPLRVAQLRVNIIRDSKTIPLQTQTFAKVIGNEDGPSMPWLATKIVQDTMLKAKEIKNVSYSDAIMKGDTIEVQLGFYVVNPKALKKLNLDNHKELEKFTILKNKYFTVE